MTLDEAQQAVAKAQQQHAAGQQIDIGSILSVLQLLLQLFGQSGVGTPTLPIP